MVHVVQNFMVDPTWPEVALLAIFFFFFFYVCVYSVRLRIATAVLEDQHAVRVRPIYPTGPW